MKNMKKWKGICFGALCALLLGCCLSALAAGSVYAYVESGRARVDYSLPYGGTFKVNYYVYDDQNRLTDFARDAGTTWYPNLSQSGYYNVRVIATDAYDRISTASTGSVYLNLSGYVNPTTVPGNISLYNVNVFLPAYQTGAFSANYAVFQGPGTTYYRAANGRALAGAGGQCRVYGTDGAWLLIGYQLTNGYYRIGYITNYTLPTTVNPYYLSALSYANIGVYTNALVDVTDDPLTRIPILETIPAGTQATFLSWVDQSKDLAFIEYWSPTYFQRVRAFVSGAFLSTTQRYTTPPTMRPTVRPTVRPTRTPTPRPTKTPTPKPTRTPTVRPTPTVAPIGSNTVLSYQKGKFSKSYAVYAGPGTDYYRNGKATLGGGGTCRIYGTDGDWLLVGYELGSGDYRIGYITNYTLPSNIDHVDPVSYAWISTYTVSSASITDDPVINMKKIETLPEGTDVTFLAWASTKHRYALIEYWSPRHDQMIRAFTRGNNLAGF